NARVPLELTREVIPSRILVPGEDGYQERQGRLEVRIDPLTGHSARLISTSKLMAASDYDLEAFGDPSRSWCPFCGERASTVTPLFPPEITADGRFRRGQALCFPNLDVREVELGVHLRARPPLPAPGPDD